MPLGHFHFLHHHHHHHGGGGGRDALNIPKGCLAITVGQGAEQQRVVIPVIYINHPLFRQLLKEAEEEYGFHQMGPVKIPCRVEEFAHVKGLIDKEMTSHHHHHGHHHHHHGHHGHHHHHHHQFLCFKA
ncbi:hypothetical protein ACP275_06G016700 [Erythranthe tilingii]